MPINLNRFDAIIDNSTPLNPTVDGGVRATQFKWNETNEETPETDSNWLDDGDDGKYKFYEFLSPTISQEYFTRYFNELTLNAFFKGGTSGTSSFQVSYQIFHAASDGRFIPSTDLVSHQFQSTHGGQENVSVVKFTDTNFDREAVANIDTSAQAAYAPFNNSTGFGFFPVINNVTYQKSTILHNGIFDNVGGGTPLKSYLYMRVKVYTVGQPFPEFKLTMGGVN